MVDTYQGIIEIGGVFTREELSGLRKQLLKQLESQTNLTVTLPVNPAISAECFPDSTVAVSEQGTLKILDANAPFGTFPKLEKYLENHEHPFDRYSAEHKKNNAEVKKYRPGMDVFESTIVTDSGAASGEPILRVNTLLSYIDEAEDLAELRRRIRKEAGQLIPDLPPLGIRTESAC